jgi:hypothetical protein
MPEKGSGRLDRIEAALERLTERAEVSEQRFNLMTAAFNLMVDHHDAFDGGYLASGVNS